MNDENLEAEILENKQKKIDVSSINYDEENKNTDSDVKKSSTIALKTKENIDDKSKEKSNINIEKTIEEKKEIEKNIKKKELKKAKEEKKKNNNKRNFKIIAILISIIIIILLAFSTVFAIINLNNTTIISGISIRNILVEGLTEDEATKIIKEKCEEENNNEIILKINGETYSITPEQIGVTYDIEKAVNKAYQMGRNGNIFKNNFEIFFTLFESKNIDIDIQYNEKLLETVLNDFNAKLANAMADNTYYIEENNLIITRGTDGIVIDVEDAKQQILKCLEEEKYGEIEIKTEYKKCPDIDIDKIYEEVKCEPQNATYQKEPFEVIPHKNGIDFNLEEAVKILSEDKEEYTIKLIITEPEVLTNEIGEEAFPDLISSFSTKYDETNVSRSTNLKIAMSKLDGVVVMPGEVFSYNKTLGKRTAAEGYKNANGFAAGKVVSMLAGGICQISSTLYDAVLYANLNIVERHNHMFQATYVEPGKDATVVYGSLDFKFENTRTYPIMIKTKCVSGIAEIKIFGIKEEIEYEVEIITNVLSYTPYKVVYEDDSSLAPGVEKVSQWGLKGCKSTTYRIVKLNGQEISKEVLSTDTYSPLNKIIRRGVSVEEQEVSIESESIADSTQNVESNTEENKNIESTQKPEANENLEPIQKEESKLEENLKIENTVTP